ncbi:magnesium transporter CorA family protein [Dongia sp.]|uniref:magnesium transporter CorA family protein n=1 Tax=Dongia sp. TaxID=1977262 RepID=UPI0035B2DD7B
MITAYRHNGQSFEKIIVSGAPNLAAAEQRPPAEMLPSHIQAESEMAASLLPPDAIWIDLTMPKAAEIAAIERAFAIEIPTREEMHEIEASSRLYADHGALFMTTPVLHRAATDVPESGAATFVLLPDRLITVRFIDPLPFATFSRRAERDPAIAATPQMILLGILEGVADRLADILEVAAADMERVSRDVFRSTPAGHHRRGRHAETRHSSRHLQQVLFRVARCGDIGTKARDSLLGLSRLVLFLTAQADLKKDSKLRLKTLTRDIASITDHANFLGGKVNFLLDATLGLINIEQNAIIKIFTVAAVAFLPPTLIASVYGMNFKFMPELDWHFGYPFAIVLMVLSALLPIWYFRRRGWL